MVKPFLCLFYFSFYYYYSHKKSFTFSVSLDQNVSDANSFHFFMFTFQLRCCNCGHSSDTYEPLIDFSLEIENVANLPSALESFTKVEKIDATFKCDSCKEEVSMEKQLILDQAPAVAAFHLKRFKTDGTFVEKIDNHVEFPLELDLQPYTSCNQSNNVSCGHLVESCFCFGD